MKNKSLFFTIAILIIAMCSNAQVTGSFTDSRDGKKYKTVKIGTQTWMAQNLAFKTSGGCWAYNNDVANVATLGYLYSWKSASTACPAGWHLPGDAAWTTLVNYLGGEKAAVAGLKSTTGWSLFNKDATNSSGFSALPGGYRDSDDFYDTEEEFIVTESGAYWWTSSKVVPPTDYKTAVFDDNYINWHLDISMRKDGQGHQFNCGLSVRCVKN